MEKYNRFAELTSQFLHGNLEKLEVDYNDDHTVTLNIFYADNNEYRFDYKITLDINHHLVEYATHVSEGYLNRVELTRESAFEKAVCNELFQPQFA
jgi:hypothetical protein